MKSILTICLLATILSFGCSSANDNEAQKEKLRSLLSRYYVSLSKADSIAIAELITDDFVCFDEGKVYPQTSAARTVSQPGNFSLELHFDSLHARIDKANASAYYIRQQTLRWKDSVSAPERFLESATFEKDGGEWKLRFLHSSRFE